MTMTQKIDATYYAIGRRKQSIAQVLVHTGKGNLTINEKQFDDYLQQNPFYLEKIQKPLKLLKVKDQYDVKIYVKGGGLAGQTDAIVLAISRAMVDVKFDYRTELKIVGLLKCDARVKERKKYGLKKARKAPQFSKR
jgi:small subunit ribosomal protein S9